MVRVIKGGHMSVTVRWDEADHSLIWIHFQQTYTWHDYDESIDQMACMVRSVKHRVDVIFLNEAPLAPGNPFPHLKRALRIVNGLPNLHMRISIDNGQVTFARVALDALRRIYAPNATGRGLFVHSVQEALNIIHADRMRQQLSP